MGIPMQYAIFVLCFLIYVGYGTELGGTDEGSCSRFVYEYKLMERLILLEQENKNLKERVGKLEDKAEPIAVAAKVRLSDNLNLAANKRVMYDVEISNIGGGYDLQTGQFVAPVTGIYMILVQACLGNPQQWMELDVIKDGALVGRVFSADDAWHSCGIEALSLKLDAGNAIWIDRNDGSATVLNQDHGWNSFTATLIQRLN